MDDINGRILSLIEKFEQGRATDEEIQELDVWFRLHESNPDITDHLTKEQQLQAQSGLLMRINSRIDLEERPSFPLRKAAPLLWAKLAVAASVLLVIAVGGWFFLGRNQPVKQALAGHIEDFAPGSNKAILTLENGEHIILDQAKTGAIASQGNAVISKTNEGNVVYMQRGKSEAVAMNTLTTPYGGLYRLTLADGTEVWLNAASSIKYPSSFNGSVREVEISGEVYMEVAQNSRQPFRVKAGSHTVEVLGTHFNINTYDSIKTTLLEGAVALTSAGRRKLLQPGEQGLFIGNAIHLNKVDLDEVMAWKNGFFDFTDAGIQTVMQEFARWYNLDVVFDGPQTKETFTGRIPRSWSFARVIKSMETFKSTHITTQGRRIMVKQQ
ncbi:FecR family protein [Filimonas effusa]|uniref:FecR family protein n=1 Tax=Filimonas effusa TaxID=2508721 RepID=A0A4Q1D0V3_9BACT|nr:FecR family protein [Filimonas effusa]RXK81312.1 FecR family protein [Filimonas effusa]